MNQVTLYIITSKDRTSVDGVTVSLKRAAVAKNIHCELLVVEDIELGTVADMHFKPGSLLYRVSTNTKAAILESMLVLLHPGVFTTIYHPKQIQHAVRTYTELCEQTAQGLRIIPTLIIDETWQRLSTDALTERAAKLGGFPVVVKTLGLSHGAGVKKVDDIESLRALLAQMPPKEYGAIARKYLADYRHYRLVVVDTAVVAAIEYHKPEGDFRTNATKEPIVSAVAINELQPDAVELAVESTKLRSSILGGVDVLVDQTDNVAYLAELNVPCYYARAEGPTGVDISALLLDAMLRKRAEKKI